MASDARHLASAYMEWAKTRSSARFNLASSGLADLPLSALSVRLEDLPLAGDNAYGYAPLLERLGARVGLPADSVVTTFGTSMANHLVLAALLAPGDDALIEEPTYSPLVDAARYLGARVVRFPRRAEDGFVLDPGAVARALTPRTRVVVLTNLHNPSSALTGADALREVGERARAVGARVLVDEVYLPALFEQEPPSAVHLGPHFVATCSLTKAWGLSGLRCGWILCDPPLARRLWRLIDLFSVPPHLAERISVLALDQLPRVSARARTLLEANRRTLQAFLDGRPELACPRLEQGMVAFPRLTRGSVEALCDRLRARYQTTVVPGRFFGAAEHFRVAYGCEAATLEGGLRGLGAVLDELR
jgi:aspartate/methionine/tyrosine aminotransferase